MSDDLLFFIFRFILAQKLLGTRKSNLGDILFYLGSGHSNAGVRKFQDAFCFINVHINTEFLIFVVNTNSKLMNKIQTLDSSDPELAQDLLLQVYELALLSQKEIDPRTLNTFIARSNKVLEKLALRA